MAKKKAYCDEWIAVGMVGEREGRSVLPLVGLHDELILVLVVRIYLNL